MELVQRLLLVLFGLAEPVNFIQAVSLWLKVLGEFLFTVMKLLSSPLLGICLNIFQTLGPALERSRARSRLVSIMPLANRNISKSDSHVVQRVATLAPTSTSGLNSGMGCTRTDCAIFRSSPLQILWVFFTIHHHSFHVIFRIYFLPIYCSSNSYELTFSRYLNCSCFPSRPGGLGSSHEFNYEYHIPKLSSQRMPNSFHGQLCENARASVGC